LANFLFAVQLAKLAGNKVVATCGGADKAALLHELGVDRVIDYKKETIKTVCAPYKTAKYLTSLLKNNQFVDQNLVVVR
jgi:NADPH:quinone reductase-like Zn-dependent oxidoreductase